MLQPKSRARKRAGRGRERELLGTDFKIFKSSGVLANLEQFIFMPSVFCDLAGLY